MRALLLSLLLLTGAATAAQNTVSFGSRLISTGDSQGKVRQVAGEPDSVTVLQTRYGGAAGERWDYYERNKTITVWIQGGRVVGIEERLN